MWHQYTTVKLTCTYCHTGDLFKVSAAQYRQFDLGFYHNITGENNGGNITSVAVKIMWMIYTCPFFNKIVNSVS